MKKQIVLGLGLAVMAAPALASKARLQALGEDTNGSFYINDNRNIFLNSAQLNNHKNLVTFETGSATGVNALGSPVDDSSANPRPEGGVFFNQGNLSYGVQLGNESNTSNSLRVLAGTNSEQNNVDAFVAGDAGVKWGANLTYGRTTNDENGTHNDKLLRTRLGVIAGDLEGFANVSIQNKSEKAAAEFEGKQGYQIGAAYSMNAYKVFGEYRSIQSEDASSDEASIKLMRLGAGRTDKLNDKASLFTKLEVTRQTANVDLNYGVANAAGVDTNGDDQITTNVPLVVGLEYDAASWLTLRGSVSQSLMSDVSQKSTTNKNLADTTTVNAGASLKFGELSVDGVVGNSTDGNNPASTAANPNAAGTNGTLRTDALMSRVSMTYRF